MKKIPKSKVRELFTASIDVVYIADIADIASCQFYGAGATFEPQKQLELMKNSERRGYLSLYGIAEFHWCISIKGILPKSIFK